MYLAVCVYMNLCIRLFFYFYIRKRSYISVYSDSSNPDDHMDSLSGYVQAIVNTRVI